MIALMNELTDMPDWERKIFDPEFTFKWKSAQLMTGKDVTRSMADWVILPLTHRTSCHVADIIVVRRRGKIVCSTILRFGNRTCRRRRRCQIRCSDLKQPSLEYPKDSSCLTKRLFPNIFGM